MLILEISIASVCTAVLFVSLILLLINLPNILQSKKDKERAEHINRVVMSVSPDGDKVFKMNVENGTKQKLDWY